MKVPGRSLRTNFAWSLAGNVCYAAGQWLAIVALARIGDAQMVGAYSLALALSSPVFLLVNLHLRTVQATDVTRQYALESYLGLRLLTLSLALAVLLVAVLFGPFGELTRLVLVPVALTRATESISDIVYGHQQQSERMDWVGKSMVVRSALSLVSLCGFLWAGYGLVAAVGASLLSSAAVTVFDVTRLQRECGSFPVPDFRRGPLTALVSTSFSLAVIMALSSLNANAPRLLLARWQSEQEVGVFSALALLPVSANVVVLALGQAAAPLLSRAYSVPDYGLFRRAAIPLCGLAALLGLAGTAGALWFGRAAVGWIYGANYVQHSDVVPLLFAGGAIGYLNAGCGYVLSSARWFQQQIGPLTAVGVVTGVLCALLIPRMGIKGAALAQLGGSAVQLAITGVIVVLCLRAHFPEVRLA